jgi:hypothetical protein
LHLVCEYLFVASDSRELGVGIHHRRRKEQTTISVGLKLAARGSNARLPHMGFLYYAVVDTTPAALAAAEVPGIRA